MKYPKILIALAFAVALGAEARAVNLTISQTNTFSSLTTGTRNLSFNLLDSAFGSSVAIDDIVSISVTGFIIWSGGSWSFTNTSTGTNSDDAIDFNFSEMSKIWFTTAAERGVFTGTEAGPNFSTDFSETFRILPEYIVPGPFIVDHDPLREDFGGAVHSSYLSEYLGAGTFDVVVNSLQSTSAEGPGIFQTTASPQFNGNVVVSYEIVPEPSAASLLIFGLGGLAALRRVRRKS